MTIPARAQPDPALSISEVTSLREFRALAGEWERLVEETADWIFLRHELLLAWLEIFARDAELRILVGHDSAGRLAAALPLVQRESRFYGLPVRELAATANCHSCRFDLLALDPERAASAFFAHLGRDERWDVLRVGDLPADGHGDRLLEAARAADLPAGVWHSQRSPYLDLPRQPAALDGALSAQLRATVRQRRRRLEALGEVTWERRERGGLSEALAECFALELAGWKGRVGTACLQEQATLDFYSRLAAVASRRGWLSLYLLRLDGRLVAFQYGLTFAGIYHLLKLSFDEELARASPGLVLQDIVVRDAVGRGLERCDYLGGDEPWKRRWSNGALSHHWLFVFRDSALGHLLRCAKFDWAPLARRWMRGPEPPGGNGNAGA